MGVDFVFYFDCGFERFGWGLRAQAGTRARGRVRARGRSHGYTRVGRPIVKLFLIGISVD